MAKKAKMLAGGIRMYRHEDYEQLKLELPFGVTLREDNRWVLLSKLFPWEDSHSVGTIYKTRFESPTFLISFRQHNHKQESLAYQGLIQFFLPTHTTEEPKTSANRKNIHFEFFGPHFSENGSLPIYTTETRRKNVMQNTTIFTESGSFIRK